MKTIRLIGGPKHEFVIKTLNDLNRVAVLGVNLEKPQFYDLRGEKQVELKPINAFWYKDCFGSWSYPGDLIPTFLVEDASIRFMKFIIPVESFLEMGYLFLDELFRKHFEDDPKSILGQPLFWSLGIDKRFDSFTLIISWPSTNKLEKTIVHSARKYPSHTQW